MSFIKNLPFGKYIISSLLAFLITILTLAVLGIIFSFVLVPDWVLRIFTDYSTLFSGFIAAFLCARASSRRGFLTGAISCVLYIGALILLGFFIFKNNIFGINLIRIFGLSVLVGGIGGILGVNSK